MQELFRFIFGRGDPLPGQAPVANFSGSNFGVFDAGL
jgi:hypothetical protein